MKNRIPSLSDFVKERNEALFSLDKEKIKKYAKKYGVPLPRNELVFWAGVYKSIIAITDAPMELKADAALWLGENGFCIGLGYEQED